MPKRPNEDSQSEPVAKRSAAESQQDLLLRAQASLDRLDFKTAEELCSDVSTEYLKCADRGLERRILPCLRSNDKSVDLSLLSSSSLCNHAPPITFVRSSTLVGMKSSSLSW